MRNGLAVLSACLLFTFSGCGGDVVEPDPERAVPEVLSIVDGDDQVGTVGTTLGIPLVVQVTDSAGEEVPGVSVIWSTDDGSVGAATTTTDAFGIAAVSWTLGSTAGEQTVRASVSGVAPITFQAFAEPGDVRSLEIVEDTATFLVGDRFQFTATAADVHGNAVPSPDLVWASLDSAVVHVDSATGELTAVASGTGRITVGAGNVSDTLQVTVKEPEAFVPVSWTRAYPLTDGTLTDVWAASGSSIFAVGAAGGTLLEPEAGGTILHFDGTYWSRMEVDAAALYSVWGSSATDVFAVGAAGTILHYDGTAWTPMDSPATEHLSGVGGTSATNVFAVGHDGGIFHYDGTRWSVMFSGTLVELHDVWGTSATNMYVVGSGGVIRHWDGFSWEAMETPTTAPLYGIWGSAGDNIYAVGGGGAGLVLHYDGTQWVERPGVGATSTLRSVAGISDSRIMVAGAGGAIRFDGSAWTPMEHRLNPAFYGVTAEASGAIHVVGAGGAILRNGSGASWQIVHSTAAANALWAVSENEAFRVGEYGTILRFDGTGWIAMESPTTADLTGVWARDGQSVYAVGTDQILYYDGTLWSRRALDLTGTFGGVHGLGLNQVYVAGSDGVAKFDGDTWTVVEPTATVAVHADASGQVHAVGGANAVRYDNTQWLAVANASGGSFMSGLWGDTPDYLLACLTGSSIAHYDGEQWQRNEVSVSCNDVHGTSRYDLFVVGTTGQINHRSGTGLGWTALSAPVGGLSLHAVHATEGRVFVAGALGVIAHGER